MLGSLNHELLLGLAFLAFQTQSNLLGGLSLFVKDRLGLSTETLLFRVVSSLTLFNNISLPVITNEVLKRNYLGEVRGLASFILGHLVNSVLFAFFAFAVCSSFLGDVDHYNTKETTSITIQK